MKQQYSHKLSIMTWNGSEIGRRLSLRSAWRQYKKWKIKTSNFWRHHISCCRLLTKEFMFFSKIETNNVLKKRHNNSNERWDFVNRIVVMLRVVHQVHKYCVLILFCYVFFYSIITHDWWVLPIDKFRFNFYT